MLPTLALFPHDPLLYDGVILIQLRYPERGIPSAFMSLYPLLSVVLP